MSVRVLALRAAVALVGLVEGGARLAECTAPPAAVPRWAFRAARPASPTADSVQDRLLQWRELRRPCWTATISTSAPRSRK